MSIPRGQGLEVFLADEDATLKLAGRMARCLPASRQAFVIYLHGDLGTGKTTVTRGMLRALGEPGAVRSPTYGLIAEYGTPEGTVLHLDLYRLRSPAELQQLGLADYLPGSRLWLIEWPEMAAGVGLPEADAVVSISVEAQGRRVRCEAASAPGHAWMQAFSADTGS
ncbi:MAG: tRNA (adenosine(37)-N6)-threonylcarbamoyltransferase complex ATPase subunit type 1 TsaE [Steroidobacteraceae bacterium]